MRILLIAMPGVGNFGDDLISVLSVQHVYDRYPDAEVGVLRYPGTIPVPYPQHKKLRFLTFPWLKDIKNYQRQKKEIGDFLSETDYILIGGGGMIQDSHSIFFIHNFIKYAFASESKKAKVGFVGIGIGPIKGRFTGWYFKKMLSRFSILQIRDEHSLQFLDTDRHQVKISEDFVAGTNNFPSEIRRYPADTPSLGCSIRPWKKLDFDKIAKLIERICNARNLSCKLFIFEYESWCTEEYDYAVRLKSYLESKRIATTIHCYVKDSYPSFIEAFGSVSCAVAVRFHANILWQKLNIPVLPISYAPKVNSLYEERGGQVLSIESIDENLNFDPYFQKIDLSSKYELPVLEELVFCPITARHKLINSATVVLSNSAAIFEKTKKELSPIFRLSLASTFGVKFRRIIQSLSMGLK